MKTASAKQFLSIEFSRIISKYNKELGTKKIEALAESLVDYVVSNLSEIVELKEKETVIKEESSVYSDPACMFNYCPYPGQCKKHGCLNASRASLVQK